MRWRARRGGGACWEGVCLGLLGGLLGSVCVWEFGCMGSHAESAIECELLVLWHHVVASCAELVICVSMLGAYYPVMLALDMFSS